MQSNSCFLKQFFYILSFFKLICLKTRMTSPVKMINLDSNVYEMLINHALSNEKEEVMGMLIGNVSVCYIN